MGILLLVEDKIRKCWDFTVFMAVIHQHWLESLWWSRSSFQMQGEIWSAAQMMFFLIPDWAPDSFLCAYKWKMSLLRALISNPSYVFLKVARWTVMNQNTMLQWLKSVLLRGCCYFHKSTDQCIRLFFNDVWKIHPSELKIFQSRNEERGGLWRWVRGELFLYGLRSLNQQYEAPQDWVVGWLMRR